MRAVSDAGPLHYLILLGEAGILARLFEDVVIAQTVRDELTNPASPPEVRVWWAKPPPWLATHADPPADDARLTALDAGERATIATSIILQPGLVLMDDRAGVGVARAMGFAVTGTLGLLYRAAKDGHSDFEASISRLRQTNFRHRTGLLEGLLSRFNSGEDGPADSTQKAT